MKLIFCFLFSLIMAMSMLYSQSYERTFSATGEYLVFDSIRVKNLTQNLQLIIAGDDWIRLTRQEEITGVEDLLKSRNNQIAIYPNPLKDDAVLNFYAPSDGTAEISICRTDGVKIALLQKNLSKGNHQFKLSGLGQGTFLVMVQGATYRYSQVVVAKGASNKAPHINYAGISESPEGKNKSFKSSFGNGQEHEISFEDGDTMQYKGYSFGVTSDIVVEVVPGENQTVDLNFPTTLKPIQSDGALYVYPEDNGIIQWYNGNWVETFGRSDTDGRANTDSILQYQGLGSYAAYICETLNQHGCNDWYLPSKEELNALYENKEAIGGFCEGDYACFYWSSTESGMANAWGLWFDNNSHLATTNKCGAYRVRCVRRP